jgi:hypothetical protein
MASKRIGFRNFARVQDWRPAPGSPHNSDYFGGDYSHREDEDFWLRAGLVDGDFRVNWVGKEWSIGHIPADQMLRKKAGFAAPSRFDYSNGTGFAIITIRDKTPWLVLYPQEAYVLTKDAITSLVGSLSGAIAKRQHQLTFLGRSGGGIVDRAEFNILASLDCPHPPHNMQPLTGWGTWSKCHLDPAYIVMPGTDLRFHKEALRKATSQVPHPFSTHFHA